MRRMAGGPRSQMELPTLLFKAKKVWPPDFKSMSPQEQLRLEKKYKRRAALATARPRWDKFIRLAQLFSVTCMYSAIVVTLASELLLTPS